MSVEFSDTFLERKLNRRIRLSVIAVSCIVFFIVFRLLYLQILKGALYSNLSTNNRIRVTHLPAPRGIIYSRDGQILVDNKPSFDLNMIPQDTPHVATLLEELSRLLSIDINMLEERVRKRRGRPPFEPVTLLKEMTWEEMSLVLSRKLELQGISIDVVPKRFYRFNSMASHVFGFLGEIDREELSRRERGRYRQGDLVGKYGLERWGEQHLQGYKGGLQTEVDAFGNRQKILAEIEPVAGSNIITTLILELQLAAEKHLEQLSGAIVAMDPASGDILVLCSSPRFDSNLFSRGIDADSWSALTRHPGHPLLNRAIQTLQPPGSVFKVIPLIAALEENSIDETFSVYCPGHYRLGSHQFGCWKKEGHGPVDMRKALVESCDVFFYHLSQKLGIDTLAHYADMLGFGKSTGIELENEKAGLVPTPSWKKKRFGVSWQRGETLIVSIGQGFLLTTPLQLNTVFCGIVNNGTIPKPRIILEIHGKNQHTVFPVKSIGTYGLSPETKAFIVDALSGVVNDPHGTGGRARLTTTLSAGKTGTAQVASKTDSKDPKLPKHLWDHAWFTGFAPAQNPEIVITVFVEHGGGGGAVAAPIAGDIMKKFFELQQQP
jgi:penicillin-binding protein 2